jgi:hypothetical protein
MDCNPVGVVRLIPAAGMVSGEEVFTVSLMEFPEFPCEPGSGRWRPG